MIWPVDYQAEACWDLKNKKTIFGAETMLCQTELLHTWSFTALCSCIPHYTERSCWITFKYMHIHRNTCIYMIIQTCKPLGWTLHVLSVSACIACIKSFQIHLSTIWPKYIHIHTIHANTYNTIWCVRVYSCVLHKKYIQIFVCICMYWVCICMYCMY